MDTFFILIAILAMFGVLILAIFILSSALTSSYFGAPYVPMGRKHTRNLLSWAGLRPDDIFYDLGSGDGRILISAVKDFHVTRAMGYEIGWWPYLKSKFTIRRLGYSNITISRRNFLYKPWNDATFIYAYLFPKLIHKVAQKFEKECKVGTKLFAPSFKIQEELFPSIRLIKTGKIGTITGYLYEKWR